MHVSSDKCKNVRDEQALKWYMILKLFQDVFLVDILEYSPHREVNFSIE